MKAFSLVTLAAAMLAVVVFQPGPPKAARDAEAARLQAHFDAVDAELRSADASRLDPSRRAARVRMIAWLREYRDARAFPRNDRFTEPRPFFRDNRGALCAMAYLIARSGHGTLVDRIAHTRNNAYIRELASDSALVAWLREAGLSAAEAARIQPEYTPIPRDEEDEPVRTGYANTSMATGAASIATMVWNSRDPSRTSGWAGLAAGAVSTAIGVAEVGSESTETRRVAVANVLVGIFALAYSSLGRRTADPAPSPTSVLLLPTVLPAEAAPTVGLAFIFRF